MRWLVKDASRKNLEERLGAYSAAGWRVVSILPGLKTGVYVIVGAKADDASSTSAPAGETTIAHPSGSSG